jgi:hypothetical protein
LLFLKPLGKALERFNRTYAVCLGAVMSTLTYSAIGTLPQYRIDTSKVLPGNLMVSNDPKATAAQAAQDASNPAAQKLLAAMLSTMGMTQSDLLKMRPDSRADLQSQMQTALHQQLGANADTSGAIVDTTA